MASFWSKVSPGYQRNRDLPVCAPGEDADGLEAFRGLCSAVIIEALALGAVWLLWNLGAWVAAWWRAR